MANGRMTVLEGRRLLRPLFETVEVNLASSRDTSGFHLFGTPNEFVPDANILIPDNFFLNTRLIADLLQLTNARAEFRSFGKLTQLENKKLIEGARVRLGGVPGDTHFAWFVPEPGFSDTDLADQLLKLGVISPHFLASLLAVDLETPIFSNQRARLLRFIPDRFEFTSIEPGTDPLEMPRDAASDLLTREVIGLIDAAQPAMGSSADRFRKLLKSEDAVKELDQLVKAYAMRVKGELDPQMPVRRETELKRLYQIALDRRRDFRRHPVLGNLDETQGQLLFPLPSD